MSEPSDHQEELLELRLGAEEALMRNPGVLGVGLGLKERGGQVTDEVAFRVYVEEKKDLAQLSPDEVVPGAFAGVPTDVLVLGRRRPEKCQDRQQYSPLVGGISICTMKPDASGVFDVGTGGFLATIDGGSRPENIVLVTNNHVVTHSGGRVGDSISQPEWKELPDGTFAVLVDAGKRIGPVFGLPDERDFPNDATGFFVDAASIRLDFSISSWCDTNCGISFASRINGLRLPRSSSDATPTDLIADVGTARIGAAVFKVGRQTGRTVGRVVDIARPASGFHNNIEVQAVAMSTPDNCGGIFRFSDIGDSGAALIDEDRKLVGLHHGSVIGQPTRSLSSHIAPVLAQLKVTPITEANPVGDHPGASGSLAVAPAVVDGKPNRTPFLRDRFLGTAEGQRLAALVEEHRLEVIDLVNHCRRVTVAWHRSRGPAFLNRAIANAADPDVPIPRSIDGITREALLLSMESALLENGSAGLRAALEEHRDEVLARVDAFDSLHDLVDSLAERQAV